MARTTVAQRRERLRRLRQAVLQRRADILSALSADLGRPRFESELVDIHHVVQEIDHAVRHLRRWMRSRRVPTPAMLFGTSSRIMFESRGVVLIMAPWNYPFSLVINPLIAAIAAGNCAVLKPSEKAPATAGLLASHFFFTGSTHIGKLVMAAAAKHLATVTLELGGKTPVIVDRTADVKAAAERIAWGKFYNAGQTCTAPDYVLVDAAIAENLVTELKVAVARFYGGDEAGRRASPDLGRIIDQEHFDRLVDLVERSVAHGARIEVGGQWDAEARYVAPTVLSGVTADAPAMEDEIFGPVLPVIAVRDLDEAEGIVRRNGKPLGSYIFSRDRHVIERLLHSVPAGGTTVNNTLMHYANSDLPFGGVGASGMGSYHGYFGFQAMSHERPVTRQRWPVLTGMLFPPYRGRLNRLARRVLSWLE
jgi:aldehyde dehydrogenase (NAD+)